MFRPPAGFACCVTVYPLLRAARPPFRGRAFVDPHAKADRSVYRAGWRPVYGTDVLLLRVAHVSRQAEQAEYRLYPCLRYQPVDGGPDGFA